MEEMILPVDYRVLSTTTRRAVRERYIQLQNNKCHFCNGELNTRPFSLHKQYQINWKLFPPNFLKYPIHLHHNHNTGMTIGAVHAFCNAVLWQYHKE